MAVKQPLCCNSSYLLQGNNDDLILSCCLHYCQDKARDFMPKSLSMLKKHNLFVAIMSKIFTFIEISVKWFTLMTGTFLQTPINISNYVFR